MFWFVLCCCVVLRYVGCVLRVVCRVCVVCNGFVLFVLVCLRSGVCCLCCCGVVVFVLLWCGLVCLVCLCGCVCVRVCVVWLCLWFVVCAVFVLVLFSFRCVVLRGVAVRVVVLLCYVVFCCVCVLFCVVVLVPVRFGVLCYCSGLCCSVLRWLRVCVRVCVVLVLGLLRAGVVLLCWCVCVAFVLLRVLLVWGVMV